MQKLIDAYRASLTLDNARKIVAYDRKHIMATCMLDPRDLDYYRAATKHAAQMYLSASDQHDLVAGRC